MPMVFEAAGPWLLLPGSHMPPNYLRHSRRYCLGYCSDIWEHTPSATTTIAGLCRRRACEVDLSSTSQARPRFFWNAGGKKHFYVNKAGDRRRCTSRKYSPQFIMSGCFSVLARFFKFTGGTSQVHLRHHCTAPGTKNHVNRRQQRRSSQVGQWHMRTRL